MTVRNNRRRFLAFLGLMGAPSALWAASARAQAGDASSAAVPSLNCQASVANEAVSVEYYRTFNLVDGTLTNDGGDALIKITEGALSHELAAGYDAPGLIQPGGDKFSSLGPTFTIDDPDSSVVSIYTFSMILKGPKVPAAVTLMMMFSETEAYSSTAKLTPGVDANSVFIAGTFDPQPKALTSDFYIRIIADTVPVAQFGFNFSQVNWQAFRDKANAEFVGKSGVTVDAATGATNVPNCNVSSDAPCFFTTASVENLGLSDDCWELRALRRFRDGPLAGTAEGRALTARYYAEAPRLVDGVNRRADARRVWLTAYWTHILPCAVMARLGLTGPAIAHYTGLFNRLERLAA